MIKHEQRVAAAFNQAASTYHQHSDIQINAGDHLIQQLLNINNRFSHVIDAGCGTGHTTLSLANSITYQSFSAIDIADDLLHQASQQSNDIQYTHADFNNISTSNAGCDLIFSNLALHWSHDLAHTFRVMHDALHDDGLFAFSIPLTGTFSEIEHHLSIQHFSSRMDIEKLLSDSGFRFISVDVKMHQKEFSDSLSALRYLKHTGTHYVRDRRHHTLHGKSFLTELNIKHLTYQIGFFIVSKQHG